VVGRVFSVRLKIVVNVLYLINGAATRLVSSSLNNLNFPKGKILKIFNRAFRIFLVRF
jgi:hypothetical protein